MNEKLSSVIVAMRQSNIGCYYFYQILFHLRFLFVRPKLYSMLSWKLFNPRKSSNSFYSPQVMNRSRVGILNWKQAESAFQSPTNELISSGKDGTNGNLRNQELYPNEIFISSRATVLLKPLYRIHSQLI